MSDVVELDRLLEVSAGFGTVPMLLTTDPDGRPRAAAVHRVAWGEDQVVRVGAGRKSFANVAERRLVSLLWPAPPDQRFALLVDAEVIDTEPADNGRGGTLVLRATSGILHVVGRGSTPVDRGAPG